jgi:hypothetical protein
MPDKEEQDKCIFNRVDRLEKKVQEILEALKRIDDKIGGAK